MWNIIFVAFLENLNFTKIRNSIVGLAQYARKTVGKSISNEKFRPAQSARQIAKQLKFKSLELKFGLSEKQTKFKKNIPDGLDVY